MKDEAYMAIGAVFACSCSLLVLSLVVWLAFNALFRALGLTAAAASLIVHRPALRWFYGEDPTSACFVCRRNCDHGTGSVVGPSAEADRAKQGATRYWCPACETEIGNQGSDHSEACTFSEEI